MIWRSRDMYRWHYRFALFPKELGRNWIWLERYAWRFVDVRKGKVGSLSGWAFRYELSHPALGSFERVCLWCDGGFGTVRTDWEPKLAVVDGSS